MEAINNKHKQNINPDLKVFDYSIKEVLSLEVQEAEADINIQEAFFIDFLDMKNQQISLCLDYDGILKLLSILEKLKPIEAEAFKPLNYLEATEEAIKIKSGIGLK